MDPVEGRPIGNLIMGAAIGLTYDQVRPFVTSLRKAGYDESVVLFVDRALARSLRRDPVARGVILIKARQWLPFRLGLLDHPRAMRLLWRPLQAALWVLVRGLGRLPASEERRTRLRLPFAMLLYTPMDTRFLRYRRYLELHPHERVLLTDVRDVVFQNDPFQHLPHTGLAVSLEVPAYTIETEVHNAAWVKRAYGSEMLTEIGANRVSCVGVTAGDTAAISTYLREMSSELLRMSPRAAGIGGADTAIHNVLLWTGRFGQVHRLEPLASPVATLTGVEEADVVLSSEGRLLNEDGSEASVLHQYDRLPRLRPGFLRALAS
jgi:hypothetical protein